jgi:hypothetical protein
MADVPPFPRSLLGTPGPDKLAARLAESVPEGDRGAARTMLADRVLPKLLAGASDHPKPKKLAEVVYGDLAEKLAAAPPEGRLGVIERAGLEAELKELRDRALSLAVARYLHDDPNAERRAGVWLDATAREWRSRSEDEIGAEATRLLERLDGWQERVKAEAPDVWETRRVDANHARLNLQSARSGSFRTAAGPLADFLRGVGAAVDTLDIH